MLTPEWLSQVLRRPVAGCVPERIGAEEGFTGSRLFRITLRQDAGAGSGPDTLVAKLAPGDAGLRAAFAAANRREVGFYTRIAAERALPVPRCHFGAFEEATGASVLLLDDLGAMRRVPFREGCAPQEAAQMVTALADLHAAFWQRPVLRKMSGRALLDEFGFQRLWAEYPAALARILPGARLHGRIAALGDFLVAQHKRVFDTLLEEAPLTCIHRDLQADNVMFAGGGEAPQARLLDWQMMGKGRGAYDLGYFLISSLAPAVRREIEAEMVRRYHDALLSRGVRGYSHAQCLSDYRKSVAGKLFATVVATTVMDNATPHKAAWRAADLERLIAFCDDHRIAPESFFEV